MGQKVNPHGLRVGVIKAWDTQWYADSKNFGHNLKEDYDSIILPQSLRFALRERQQEYPSPFIPHAPAYLSVKLVAR